MKTIPDGLAAHLAQEATTLCHAWRVTRRDGVVLGFTDHDHDLSFDGTSFLASSGFEASDWESAGGMAATSGEVAGALSSDAIAEADVAAGKYDGARVDMFLVNWADIGQHLRLRTVEIGEVTRSEGFFRAELRGAAHKLDESRGRIYSRRCDAKFGDVRCGKNANTSEHRASGTVASADVDRITALGLDAFAPGTFRYGSLRFTSGANAGVRVDVESHRKTGGEVLIDFWLPMAIAPEPGDAFQITVGCDKTFDTCRLTFNNQRNFRGFPHMPGADFTYGYADGETEHDGGPLYE
ncbi:DUF2163 domain-containing protein [Rhizobium sp.]